MIPPDQPDDTFGQHFVIAYTTPDCSGSSVQLMSIGAQVIDVWTSVSKTFITDSTAASVNFTIGVAKPTGVNDVATAHFDNAYFRKSDAGGNRIIDEKLSGPGRHSRAVLTDLQFWRDDRHAGRFNCLCLLVCCSLVF